jgi:hypothetical protein
MNKKIIPAVVFVFVFSVLNAFGEEKRTSLSFKSIFLSSPIGYSKTSEADPLPEILILAKIAGTSWGKNTSALISASPVTAPFLFWPSPLKRQPPVSGPGLEPVSPGYSDHSLLSNCFPQWGQAFHPFSTGSPQSGQTCPFILAPQCGQKAKLWRTARLQLGHTEVGGSSFLAGN